VDDKDYRGKGIFFATTSQGALEHTLPALQWLLKCVCLGIKSLNYGAHQTSIWCQMLECGGSLLNTMLKFMQVIP